MRHLRRLSRALRAPDRASPFVQAEVVTYDPATHLSTINVDGDEVANVPKLAHVSLGGWWEPVASGFAADVASVVIPIPRAYVALRIRQGATITATTTISLRVNNDSGLTHRRGYLQYDSEGNLIQSHYGSGTLWYTNRIATVMSSTEILLAQALSSVGENFWQFQAYGKRNGGGASSHSVFLGFGSLNDPDVELTSLRLGISGTETYVSVNWEVEGQVPYAPEGRQVQCLRDRGLYTIIGVLDGRRTAV